MSGEKKLAVLIDGDNAPPGRAAALFAEVAKYGIASVKRVYGDWSSPALGGWQKILLKHALVPVQQFAYTKNKDTTDMGLVIEAMDLLYSDKFDGFCLVSSDSDFTPLASRIRAQGLAVYGFGEKKTPEAFRNSCDKFIYVENLETLDDVSGEALAVGAGTGGAGGRPVARQPIEGALKAMLFNAIKDVAVEGGWASVAQIGSYLSQTNADFDPRSYGYSKLSSMLKELKGVHYGYATGDRSQMYFRKTPWSDLVVAVREAHQNLQDDTGSASIAEMEEYLQSRLDCAEYGFPDLTALLEEMHGASIDDGRLSLKAKPPTP